MTFSAVVPLAFFSWDNVEMTESFLARLLVEPGLGTVHVYLNGGQEGPELAGRRLVKAQTDMRVFVHDARGWPFYRMWNQGITDARWFSSVALILNNDIEWPQGALAALAEGLTACSGGTVVVTPALDRPMEAGIEELPLEPGRGGHRDMTCCWAVRTDIFDQVPRIDERFQVWYGDNDLGRQIDLAGLKVERMPGIPVKHRVEATMGLLPGVMEKREADRVLFESKWAT